jgi:hypothetical protein
MPACMRTSKHRPAPEWFRDKVTQTMALPRWLRFEPNEIPVSLDYAIGNSEPIRAACLMASSANACLHRPIGATA